MKCSKCGFEFAEGIFCPECGTKNDLNELVEEAIVDDSEDEEEIADIDKAMEDILFYYEQSGKKKEAVQRQDSEHLYYNRAQQLLKRLIKQKSSDYRVWWEASKPIDFWEDTFSEEMIVKYKIDDTYFAKSLYYADIEVKKKMIDERDSYQERKRNALDKIQAEKKIEEDRIAAEKRVADKKKEEERKERERLECEKQKEIERMNQEKEEEEKLKKEGKVMAILSLIFGIFSLCTFGCWFIPEILGIVFAFQGKKQGVMRGQAKAGLICSCISVVIMLGILVLGMSL